MKKKNIIKKVTFLVSTTVLVAVTLAACADKNKEAQQGEKQEVATELVSEIEQTTEVETESALKKENNISNLVLADVYNNKKQFIDMKNQENVYLKDYVNDTYMHLDESNKYIPYDIGNEGLGTAHDILCWCEVDLDRDGVSEVVIEYSNGDHLVLHVVGNDVCGYLLPYREMSLIYEDGSFKSSDSAACTYIGKLEFEGPDCYYKEICVYDGIDEVYRINEAYTNEKAAKEFLEKYNEKNKIKWYGISD